jgi:hypothetical protein
VTPQGRHALPENTVPINIEVTEGSHHIRESFLWNLTDTSLDPEGAAALICKRAPVLLSSALAARVATSIRSQVEGCALFAPAASRKGSPRLVSDTN